MVFDDLFAMPSAAGVHNTLVLAGDYEYGSPALSLTGGTDSPPTPEGSNDPGLEAKKSLFPFGGDMTKTHWIILALVVLALLGLWYFSGSGTAA